MTKYAVTIKYTGKKIQFHEELEFYKDYLQYFEKYSQIISRIAVEFDKTERMHCHFTAEISESVNRKDTFSRKGLHLKIKEIKTDFDLARWDLYINKETTSFKKDKQGSYYYHDEKWLLYEEGDNPFD